MVCLAFGKRVMGIYCDCGHFLFDINLNRSVREMTDGLPETCSACGRYVFATYARADKLQSLPRDMSQATSLPPARGAAGDGVFLSPAISPRDVQMGG